MYNALFIKQETANNNQTKLAFHMLATQNEVFFWLTSTKGVKWGRQIISISEH